MADFSDRFGIAAECRCDAAADRLSPRAQAELLRIVQEALANVRKHADATLVRVELSDRRRLELRVTDNGRGFATDQVGRAGYGLSSMEQRAAIIGGSLTIDSREQDGTRVLVQMPLAAEGDDGPMSEQPTRVMLVDDHALVRSAVRQALAADDLEIVGEAASADEALLLAPQLAPDVLLLDINLPGTDGLRLL